MTLGWVDSAWCICIHGALKWVLQHNEERESWALSSCSSTTLRPFHADDWFRCGEEGEERSGSGLCPLITLHYHTGGIYHQTPKASVHREHWNQSLRLHAIHPGPRKAALWSATTSIFSVRGDVGEWKIVKDREQWGKKGFKGTLGCVLGNYCRIFLFLPLPMSQ